MLSYTEWILNEGGWSSVKTQGIKITPAILKVADDYVKQLFADFEKWMSKTYPDTLPLKGIRPVGSGIYYEEDLKNEPEKIYGDIDYLVEYPVYGDSTDPRKTETEAIRFYNKAMFQFFNETKYKGVDLKDSRGADGTGAVLIAEVQPNVYIQVDFVATHAKYVEWALDRFTPIHNIKGFVSGNLYSSLADALSISMGDRGARAKLQAGVLVPFRMRKDVEELAISMNFKTLFADIVSFFMSLKDNTKSPEFQQSDIAGIDSKNLTLAGIAKGISSLADVLERNGVLDGKTVQFKNAGDMKRAVSQNYSGKMAELRGDSKFNKAADPMAIATRDKIFKVSKESEDEVASILK